jgi:DNA-binding transcriptional regulator YiaG
MINMVTKVTIVKEDLIALRLNGATYLEIAKRYSVSRQYIQQLISPPKDIRDFIVKKYNGLCRKCGIHVGVSGHVHHKGTTSEDYNDIENLELLCVTCHRLVHHHDISDGVSMITGSEIKEVRKSLGITQGEMARKLKVDPMTVSRWERGEQRPTKKAERQISRLARKGTNERKES